MSILFILLSLLALWLGITIFNSLGRRQVVLAFGSTEITPVLYPNARGSFGGRNFFPYFDYDRSLSNRRIGFGVFLTRK